MLLNPPNNTKQIHSILSESGLLGGRGNSSIDSKPDIRELLDLAGASPESALRNLVDLANDGTSPQTKLQANKIILELNGIVREETQAKQAIVMVFNNPDNINVMNILCPS